MAWYDFIPAVIGGVTSLIGSEKAASAQESAANRAADTTWDMYQQGREDLGPYRDIGANALYQMAAATGVEYEGAPGTIDDRYQTALGRFYKSPDYQFRVGEGIDALDRSASARGKLMSGSQLKAISDWGQNTASGEWGNYLNRLAAQSGIGQTATGQTAGLGANAASNIANAQMAGGTARASGYSGAASGINQALNNAMYYYGRQ